MSEQSAPAGRREQFEEEIAAVRIRTGKAEAEQRFTILGLVALIGGVVICAIAYFASTGQSDTRDVISSVILALLGVSVTVLGAALFLRYSVARFLRFWLLRLIYEQRDADGP
jgi:ABC-type Fe3+-siderophore transport system permease subunit